MRRSLALTAVLLAALPLGAIAAGADVPPLPPPPAAPFAPAPVPTAEPGTFGFEAVPAAGIPAMARQQMGIPETAKVVAVQLVAGGAAEAAGMKVGDPLLKVGGKDLPSTKDFDGTPAGMKTFAEAFQASLGTPKVGATLEVVVERGGQPVTLTLTALAERGYLGFNPVASPLLPEATRAKWKLKADAGVVVARVTKGSPAEAAGLKVGDVILQFAGQAVPALKDFDFSKDTAAQTFSAAFTKVAIRTRPGKEVELVVERDGKPVTLKATALGFAAMAKLSAASQDDDDEDGEGADDDEGHEGPEAPEKAPTPAK